MEATEQFVKNFTTVNYDQLSTEVIETTKKQVLDFFGVALAGSAEEGAKQIAELYAETGGVQQSSVIFWGHKMPAANAAQVNATMAHALDYDDVHEAAIIHPGVITVSTSLAMAEYKGGLSGKDFIAANALGADFICRLGLATRPGQNVHAFGWHLTSIYGFMTAAAVAGMVLGFDAETLLNAIGIGYHQSSGNGQCVKDGALTKRMGPGFAVRGGIIAALLAERGVTGARYSIEGRAGIYKVYHQGSYSPEILLDGLGSRMETANVSIKPYPCCRGTHPSIDAALSLVKKHDLDPAAVESVRIWLGEGTYGLLGTPLEVKARPRNVVDGQFSVPWCVATAIARRQVKIEHFTEAAIHSEDILAIAGKIQVELDPALSNPGIEPARVRITTRDGVSFTEQVDFPTGTPHRPLSYAACAEKFRDCISHAPRQLPEDKAEKLVALIARLEELGDVRELLELVQ